MFDRLIALNRGQIVLLASLCLVVIGTVDWVTGPEIALSIFYLVPVALVAASVGKKAGLATALGAGAVWLGIEVATNHLSHPAIAYWNGAVRTGIFSIFAWIVALIADRTRELRSLNASLAKMVEERSAALRDQTALLESILNSIGEGVVVADAAGRVVKHNPAAERILGCSPAETDLAAPHPGHDHDPSLGQALRGVRLDAEEIHWPISGRWIALTARPVTDPLGSIKGGVVVFHDVTERRLLERQVAEASEREQRRLGEDLHDSVCQQLVSIAFAARLLADKLAESRPVESRDAAELVEMLNAAISQARQVARGLYLVGLEEDGLVAVIEEMAAQIRSRHQINCAFCSHTTTPVEDPVTARELFRIAQEAVANALKHGHPEHLQITLDADDQRILLCIENDGIPIPPKEARGDGMGLHLMRHRARLIGGTLTIDSSGPGGTEVVCEVPRWNPPLPTP
jgi:PAS domain S-box-containing protein